MANDRVEQMATSFLRTVAVWGLRLFAVYLAVSFVVAPPLSVYLIAGWEWAVLTALAWLGLLAFLVRFGPYLIARALARAVASDIEAMAEDLNEQNEQLENAGGDAGNSSE